MFGIQKKFKAAAEERAQLRAELENLRQEIAQLRVENGSLWEHIRKAFHGLDVAGYERHKMAEDLNKSIEKAFHGLDVAAFERHQLREENKALWEHIEKAFHGLDVAGYERSEILKELRKPLDIPRLFSIRPQYAIHEPIGLAKDLKQKDTDIDHFAGHPQPVDWKACQEKDTWPVPDLRDREHYFPDQDLDYWISGLRDYTRIVQELAVIGKELPEGAAVFDMGASSGRVLRHFLAQHPHPLRLFSSDVNENHVEWISRNLPPVCASVGLSVPFLPYEDNSMDLVTAFSVFTHMDEWESTWLMELHRILKPGGYAWLTVQTEDTWASLDEEHFLYQHLRNSNDKMSDWEITPELFKNPMPQEKVVFRFLDSNVYNTCTFQSQAYVERVWGSIFDIVAFLPRGSDFQDVYLMHKPA